MDKNIYKICTAEQWQEVQETGRFRGAPVDLADGFIHFSTASQVQETATKHFAGVTDLFLLAVETEKLGDALNYEVSRGGALFPHLYAELTLDAVVWAKPLANDENGIPRIPDME